MNTSLPTSDAIQLEDMPVKIVTVTGRRYEPTETDLVLVGPETYQEIRLNDQPVSLILAGQVIPVITGFTPDGRLIREIDIQRHGTADPATCDHADGCYSDNIATKCPTCRIPLFLPPRLLAHLPRATVETMHELWRAAGWPAWEGRAWDTDPTDFTLHTHPLFSHCAGGIPVRHDRRQNFVDACQALNQ